MIKYLIFAFSMIVSTNIIAQPNNNDRVITKTNNEVDNKNFRDGSFEAKLYNEVKGSPYLCDDFVDGLLSGKDIESISGKFRYNIYTDKIEFPFNDKIFCLGKPWIFNLCKIGDTKLYYQQYLDGTNVKKGFLIVLVEGKYSLFLKKKITYKAEEPAGAYQTEQPNRFEYGEDSYFLAQNDEPAKRISTVKNLKKAFPELTQIIDTYKESTNIRRQSNIVNFINYINNQANK